MKLNRTYLTVTVYALISCASAILFGFCCFRYSEISAAAARLFKAFKPVFWGVSAALLLNPMYSVFYSRTFAFVSRKKPHIILRKALALILTYLILLSMLSALIVMIIPQATESILSFASQSTVYLSAAQDRINRVLSFIRLPDRFRDTEESTTATDQSSGQLPPDTAPAPDTAQTEDPLIRESLHIDIVGMAQQLLEKVLNKLTDAIPRIINLLGRVVDEVKDFSLGLILSVYLLASRERLGKITRKLLAALFGKSGHDRLLSFGKLYYHSFISFLTGKFLDAVIVTCLCYIVLTLFGMPSALMLSLIPGILNLIPFLGPIIGAFIGAVIVLLIAPSRLLLYLIVIILIQQLDVHLIEPHIIGARAEIPNFWILISVILMGNAFGVIGMFLAVPTFTVLGILARSWTDKRLSKKAEKEQPAAEMP